MSRHEEQNPELADTLRPFLPLALAKGGVGWIKDSEGLTENMSKGNLWYCPEDGSSKLCLCGQSCTFSLVPHLGAVIA